MAFVYRGAQRRRRAARIRVAFAVVMAKEVVPAAFRLLGRAGRKGLILSVCRAYSAFKKPHGKKVYRGRAGRL